MTDQVSTLDARLSDLVSALANDVNNITQFNNEARTALSTQVKDLADKIGGLITDAAESGSSSTWSVDKIVAYVHAQVVAAESAFTPDVVAQLHTLAQELAGSNGQAILTALAGSVRFDLDQTGTITAEQAAIARKNIGAISHDEAAALVTTAVSDVDHAAAYLQARTVKCE